VAPNRSVYFFFIDGIGVGQAGPQNPFHTLELPGFRRLMAGGDLTAEGFSDISEDGLVVRAIDANLGLEGLPQSGTGQATLFTGVNCAELAGRHYGPFPHSTSRPILKERNLFTRVGPDRAALANAYPERFFEWALQRDRWSTTTRCCLDSGVHIRTMDDLRAGKAISADLTGAGLAAVANSPVKAISEKESAERIQTLCGTYHLVVSEYFHTDKAGHAQDSEDAGRRLRSIDRYLSELMDTLDFSRTTLVLTSDHGNIEDLSVKTHTRHPVPLLVRGPGSSNFKDVTDLTGLAKGILAST
jgi:hypothetical protein